MAEGVVFPRDEILDRRRAAHLHRPRGGVEGLAVIACPARALRTQDELAAHALVAPLLRVRRPGAERSGSEHDPEPERNP
jgi:hypothetical protein